MWARGCIRLVWIIWNEIKNQKHHHKSFIKTFMDNTLKAEKARRYNPMREKILMKTFQVLHKRTKETALIYMYFEQELKILNPCYRGAYFYKDKKY